MSLAADTPRIAFIDVDDALGSFMNRGMPDPVRVERSFRTLLTGLRQDSSDREVCVYGEMAERLCQRANYAAALQLEQLWNARFNQAGVSVLCGYSIECFREDEPAHRLRAVCREHSHVFPVGGDWRAATAAGDLVRSVVLEHRALTTRRALAADHVERPVVCVVDDDPSVRRSVERLLGVSGLAVKTFDSAEEFLDQISTMTPGCLILDIQLPGMSGLDLQQRLAGLGWSIIVASGSQDRLIEREALRQGALLFLRKPFTAAALLDGVARVFV